MVIAVANCIHILYSRKIWWGIKFGNLTVYITTAKLKSAKIFYLHIYVWRSRTQTAKFKSANILAMAILGSTTKLNSRQYFWLCGSTEEVEFRYYTCEPHTCLQMLLLVLLSQQ